MGLAMMLVSNHLVLQYIHNVYVTNLFQNIQCPRLNLKHAHDLY